MPTIIFAFGMLQLIFELISTITTTTTTVTSAAITTANGQQSPGMKREM